MSVHVCENSVREDVPDPVRFAPGSECILVALRCRHEVCGRKTWGCYRLSDDGMSWFQEVYWDVREDEDEDEAFIREVQAGLSV